jgi:hypothetical protein
MVAAAAAILAAVAVHTSAVAVVHTSAEEEAYISAVAVAACVLVERISAADASAELILAARTSAERILVARASAGPGHPALPRDPVSAVNARLRVAAMPAGQPAARQV